MRNSKAALISFVAKGEPKVSTGSKSEALRKFCRLIFIVLRRRWHCFRVRSRSYEHMKRPIIQCEATKVEQRVIDCFAAPHNSNLRSLHGGIDSTHHDLHKCFALALVHERRRFMNRTDQGPIKCDVVDHHNIPFGCCRRRIPSTR
jgi:hypothetical protein